MNPITVFEHGRIELLTGAEKTLLDQLRGPRNERMFEVGWRETWATSHVGLVQLDTRAIQVLPKMYRDEADNEQRQREATANLLFLLSYTRKLAVTEPETSRLTAQRAPFSDILFWVFAHWLWDAVHPDGGCRGYVTIEDRIDVLKARWLVAAQAPKAFGAGGGTGSMSPTTNSPRTTSPTGSSRPPSIASPAGRNGPTPAGT